ncbi:Rac/Rho-like_protein [Hexamita inflata]|uniref:Rac/Rho-like protein n=1 Tax=Hexamita inflata TaxID=28002 RepID=A0AA86UZQ3_9EUKA|nr:Rac/Rho-like protein [Hexamita inflata]
MKQNKQIRQKQIKITFVGDNNKQRNGFLQQFFKLSNNCFIQVVEEYIEGECTINNQLVSYKLQDTPCQEDYDRIRHLYYRETDIFVVCYQVVDLTNADIKQSFNNIRTKWIPEIRQYSNAPIIILGTESELLHTPALQIQDEEITELVRDVGAQMHIISSSKHKYNIQLVIHQALHIILNQRETTRKKCKCCK